MDLLELFGQHEVTITPAEGSGAWGTQPGEPYVQAGVFVTEQTRQVRNSAGDTVVSSAQIAMPKSVGILPDGTTIRLPSGRETTVISVETVPPMNGIPFPDHTVVNCK